MFLEDLEQISKMGLSVVLFGLNLDVIDVISFFPKHVCMMLDEERVVYEFSAKPFLLLDLRWSILVDDLEVISIDVLDVRKDILT